MLSNAKAAGDIGALIAAGVAGGFAGGVANGLLNGASLGQSLVMGIQGAVFGGISAGLAYGIGHQMGVVSGNVLLRSIAHGITRGIMNTAIGGNFRSGFMSNFASEMFGSMEIGLNQGIEQMAFHTLVGGTVSMISGGKFANGAVSSAVVYLFNDMMRFNGKELEHYDDNGKLLNTYKATSGRPGTTSKDQNAEDTGPIPEGKYTIYPEETSEVQGWSYYKRLLSGSFQNFFLADWGNYRVVLHPMNGTETYGRDNFFLHGGLWPGSAGCIDVGIYDAMIFRGQNGIMWQTNPIQVTVDYQ